MSEARLQLDLLHRSSRDVEVFPHGPKKRKAGKSDGIQFTGMEAIKSIASKYLNE